MQVIKFERTNSVGHIVLANPPKNLIDSNFSDFLKRAVHQAGESNIRALLVRAEGPNFSQGGDVLDFLGKDTNSFRTFIGECNQSFRAIEALQIPTVAAVRGAAFGGAFELALACDFIVAAEDAIFRCIEASVDLRQSLARYKGWQNGSVVRAQHVTRCFANQFRALLPDNWASPLSWCRRMT